MTRYFSPCLFCFLLLVFALPVHAGAEEGYYNSVPEGNAEAGAPPEEESKPASRSVTVTSIEKCYAQLSREDALDIQKNYIKPYGECQRRLALKLKKEQTLKTGDAKTPPPESPAHFYRVQKGAKKPSGKPEDKTPAKPPVFEQKTAPLG